MVKNILPEYILMTDVHSKETRSYNMSQIRGKWTKQEILIHNILKGRKIKHMMHPDIEGKPDILIKNSKTLIFLDGCFWHKCPRCFRQPETNREFWMNKIENNFKKDKEVTKKLKRKGWTILRLWEHEIRENLSECIKRIELFSNK